MPKLWWEQKGCCPSICATLQRLLEGCIHVQFTALVLHAYARSGGDADAACCNPPAAACMGDGNSGGGGGTCRCGCSCPCCCCRCCCVGAVVWRDSIGRMPPEGVRKSLAPKSMLSSGCMTITGTAMAARCAAASCAARARARFSRRVCTASATHSSTASSVQHVIIAAMKAGDVNSDPPSDAFSAATTNIAGAGAGAGAGDALLVMGRRNPSRG